MVPRGRPPPHRHDVEETFVLVHGELEATFRGQKRTEKAGETIHIPANAPHQFIATSAADGPNGPIIPRRASRRDHRASDRRDQGVGQR